MVLLGELAWALGASGEYREALRTIDETLERAQHDEERWYLPELMCMKGRILLLESGTGAEDAAEGQFLQAIACARQQEALSMELRSATALARLRASSGRAPQARAELLPVFERFTEGFGTADLREAQTILDQLH
jgi:predicted ATPase